MESKKGISSVLSNVLIILLVVIAVSIVAILVNSLTSKLDSTITKQQVETDCAVKFANDKIAYDDCIQKISVNEYAQEFTCNAKRFLSINYTPSSIMTIKVNVTFNVSNCGGAFLESVPLGWNVTGITGLGSGTLDSSGRNIRWGPFDGPACGGVSNLLLTYNVTPGALQNGAKFFQGQFSVDGKNCLYPDNYTLRLGNNACFIYYNYSDWTNCKFNSSEKINPLIVGENADSDGDGIVNFLEYSLGMDPHQNSLTESPKANWLNGDLIMNYNQIRTLNDVIYTPQVARCLSSLCFWNQGPNFVANVSINDTGDIKKIVTVRDANSWNYDFPGYMRLNITNKITNVSYIIDASKVDYPTCGNGVLNSNEVCEVGLGNLDCRQYNHYISLTNELKEGLVLFYTFDNSFNDSSSRGNNGTGKNNISFVDSSFYRNNNSVASFDGVDDYIEVPASKSLEGENMTYSFWINLPGYTIPDFYQRTIFSKGNPNINNIADWTKYDYRLSVGREKNGGGNIYHPTYDGNLKLYLTQGIADSDLPNLDGSQASSNFAASQIEYSNWNMVTITRSLVDMSIFVNGIKVKTNSFPSFEINDWYNSNSSLFIGSYPYGRGTYTPYQPISEGYFEGKLDNLMIYNKTLSDDQISQIYGLENKNFKDYFYNGTLNCYNCTLNFGSCDIVNYDCYYYSWWNESICTAQPGCHYNAPENGCAQANGATCDQLGARNSWLDEEACLSFGCGYNGTSCTGNTVLDCSTLTNSQCQTMSYVDNACRWPGQCYNPASR